MTNTGERGLDAVPSPQRTDRSQLTLETSKEKLFAGEPLQIVRLDMDNNVVELIESHIQTIQKQMSVSGAESVSIISIMGEYRTGKSFFLDLLMRYLRSWGEVPESATVRDGRISKYRVGADANPGTFPQWFTKGGDAKVFSEGLRKAGTKPKNLGFEWQAGMQKCTEGIWMWSQPLIFKQNGERVAVLLMDTQGAWDSRMTKEQSATVFGLTAVLSSKLIYNIQNRCSETKVDQLDYFTSFAKLAAREMKRETGSCFGNLECLIRDWEYYGDDWDMKQCEEQMVEHLKEHLDPGQVPSDSHGEAVQRIRDLFRGIHFTGLPHPGKKIPKTTWDGTITDIENDFAQHVDQFMHRIFAGDFPVPSAPFGTNLTVGNFLRVVREFVKAFENAKPSAQSLRQAFVECELHRCHDNLEELYEEELKRLSNNDPCDPEVLRERTDSVRNKLVNQFIEEIAALDLQSDVQAEHVAKFKAKVEKGFGDIVAKNDAELKSATMKLVATPVVVLPAASIIFALPHILLWGVAGLGGFFFLRTKAEAHQSETCSFVAIEAMGQDVFTFAHERVRDVHAMSVAAKRCNTGSTLALLADSARKMDLEKLPTSTTASTGTKAEPSTSTTG